MAVKLSNKIAPSNRFPYLHDACFPVVVAVSHIFLPGAVLCYHKPMRNKSKLILVGAVILTAMAGTWALISNNASAPTSQNQKPPVTINDPISDAVKQVDEQTRSSTGTPAQTTTNKYSSSAVTAPAPNQSSPTQQPSAQTSQPQTTTQPAIQPCPDYRRASIVSTRDAAIANEIARHTRAMSAIDADWLGRGMGFSGGYQAAKDQENALNTANIAKIDSDYQASLATNQCN